MRRFVYSVIGVGVLAGWLIAVHTDHGSGVRQTPLEPVEPLAPSPTVAYGTR